MSTPRQTEHKPATDRSGSGPGSSHQGGSHGHTHYPREDNSQPPGDPTNSRKSGVSGGGGVRDERHTHNPDTKS